MWITRKNLSFCTKRRVNANKLKYTEEKEIKVIYNDKVIGKFKLDLIVDDKIVVEIKSAEKTIKLHKEQIISYLKVSGYKVGLLINFGTEKLEYYKFYREMKNDSS
ncbi:MAG: GxxExxY protein [Thermodesulfovibrio sp.]|nr:GxxExxY protein [Thermodesulfovibrio sp.]MCX7941280.1 GxxExxY protein [Endomicrobiia bacterium]